MFLLGLYLGKNKIYNSMDTFIEQIKKPILIVAIITNVYRILFLFVLVEHDIFKIESYREVLIKIMVLSDVAMGLFYLWVIGWIYYKTKWNKILLPLKYVGRMALTNYIMQSFIGLILFSSIGFKLYETLSRRNGFLYFKKQLENKVVNFFGVESPLPLFIQSMNYSIIFDTKN